MRLVSMSLHSTQTFWVVPQLVSFMAFTLSTSALPIVFDLPISYCHQLIFKDRQALGRGTYQKRVKTGAKLAAYGTIVDIQVVANT
jgi:hypothetical protein